MSDYRLSGTTSPTGVRKCRLYHSLPRGRQGTVFFMTKVRFCIDEADHARNKQQPHASRVRASSAVYIQFGTALLQAGSVDAGHAHAVRDAQCTDIGLTN